MCLYVWVCRCCCVVCACFDGVFVDVVAVLRFVPRGSEAHAELNLVQIAVSGYIKGSTPLWVGHIQVLMAILGIMPCGLKGVIVGRVIPS